MPVSGVPRVVLVTRPTEYEGLIARHGTHEAARFFLETRGRSIDDAQRWHRAFLAARRHVMGVIPPAWRRSQVVRADLDRFLFEPGDIVVALGQDGLVANVAKYLDGQAVIGLNPDPGRYDGILVPHPPDAAGDLLRTAAAGRGVVERRTMAEALLDDGQRLLALNEVFLGHRSHQSARYVIEAGEVRERQSSSGVIVATGTGCTGWARSIALERGCAMPMPAPAEPGLVFFVREAFPSVATATSLTEGAVGPAGSLAVVSEMDDGGVIFGDGVESDRLPFVWGAEATVRVAAERLHLLRG